MKIENIEFADFCEDGTTVSVTAVDDLCKSETFYIQTVDGEFRRDLGCWIFTDKDGDDIVLEYYPRFDYSEIIAQAEKFIQSQVDEQLTNYFINSMHVYLLVRHDKIQVVTRNNHFISADTSTYQREFSEPLFTADNMNEVNEYLSRL